MTSPNLKVRWVMSRLGNGHVIVRDFGWNVPLTLPTVGRAEEEINKFSRTFTCQIPGLLYVPHKYIMWQHWIGDWYATNLYSRDRWISRLLDPPPGPPPTDQTISISGLVVTSTLGFLGDTKQEYFWDLSEMLEGNTYMISCNQHVKRFNTKIQNLS